MKQQTIRERLEQYARALKSDNRDMTFTTDAEGVWWSCEADGIEYCMVVVTSDGRIEIVYDFATGTSSVRRPLAKVN